MRSLLATLIAIASLALVACGGDSADESATSGGSAGAGSEPTKVTVTTLPIIDAAALQLGIKQGFFEEEGLEVNVEYGQSQSAIVATVVSGNSQIGQSAPVPLLQAVTKGLPVKALASAIAVGDEVSQAIMVDGDGPIRKAKDLNGKTIAVNTLKGTNQLQSRASLDARGADSSTFRFVQIPFSDQQAALGSGQADAAFLVEPFITAAKEAGERVLVANPQKVLAGDGATLSAWVASESFLNDQPDAAEGFKRAIEQSNSYASEHPDEVRSILTTYTRIEPDVAEKVALGAFAPSLDPHTFEITADLMEQYGLVEEAPPVSEVVHGS